MSFGYPQFTLWLHGSFSGGQSFLALQCQTAAARAATHPVITKAARVKKNKENKKRMFVQINSGDPVKNSLSRGDEIFKLRGTRNTVIIIYESSPLKGDISFNKAKGLAKSAH